QTTWFATYQRWEPTIAAEPLRSDIAGGLLLEYPTESFVQATDRSWKNSQARPRRLRPQAPNLRQYGRCPRDPLEVRASNHLMVAQHEDEDRAARSSTETADLAALNLGTAVLLRRDFVGADHLAPELDLALAHGARG